MASTFVSKGIAFVGSIFIARILFPEDFGYIILAEIISGFIMLVANSGFENFYLQEKIENEDYEAEVLGITHRLRLLFNAALFLIQVGVSFVVQYAFGEEIVGTIVRILALGHLLNGITMSRQYVLRKRLEFRIESVANIVRDALSTVAKVGFAFTGLGAVSIAMGAIVGGLGRSLVFLKGCRKIPMSKEWDRVILKRVWHFGMHSFSGGIGIYLSNYIDKILLSVTFNKSEMGFYSFGYGRADMVKAYTIRPLGSLIVAWIAKYKGAKSEVMSKISQITYIETSLLTPIILFLLVFADWMIPFVFSDRWVFAIPLFRIFLVMHLVSCLTGNIGNILTGFGFPKLLSQLVWTKMVTLGVALGILAQFNNLMVYAVAFSTVSIAFAILKAQICLEKVDSSFLEYLKRLQIIRLLSWGAVYLLFLLGIHEFFGSSTLAIVSALFIVTVLFLFNHLFVNRVYTRSILKTVVPPRFSRFLDLVVGSKTQKI